jgi:hypothetical protein
MAKESNNKLNYRIIHSDKFHDLNFNRGLLEERLQVKTTLYGKLFCWACGLYQTDCNLCFSCHNCNKWTLNKIYSDSFETTT